MARKMKQIPTQPINFDVCEVSKAYYKHNTAVVSVQYHSNPEKIYTYHRRWTERKNDLRTVLIQGVEIWFDQNYHVTKIRRVKDVQGKKMMDTSKGKTPKNTTSKPKHDDVKTVEEKLDALIADTKAAKSDDTVDLNGEIKHEQYDTVKACLECGIPVYLAGAAGSGKNYTVEQICDELGWGFYFSNSVQQEYKLTGFIDAGGKFHETEFFKACTDENPCVFFLDEMDASIPEVLVLLNAAIANGYFEFPTGRVDLENVHFVAAGNTVGNGADEQYTGRMVIDQATLDRFAIIEFGYSRRVEMSISKNNADLVDFIHSLRDDAEAKGIRATFSYRCISMVTKLEAQGMNLEMIIKIAVVKGLDKDTVNTLHPFGFTKYHTAFEKVRKAA